MLACCIRNLFSGWRSHELTFILHGEVAEVSFLGSKFTSCVHIMEWAVYVTFTLYYWCMVAFQCWLCVRKAFNAIGIFVSILIRRISFALKIDISGRNGIRLINLLRFKALFICMWVVPFSCLRSRILILGRRIQLCYVEFYRILTLFCNFFWVF